MAEWWTDWDSMWPKPTPKENPAREHFEVELTPKMREALLGLLKGGKIDPSTLKLIVIQIESARLMDGPLFVAKLNWAQLEAEAERQGVGPADVLWDWAAGKDPQ